MQAPTNQRATGLLGRHEPPSRQCSSILTTTYSATPPSTSTKIQSISAHYRVCTQSSALHELLLKSIFPGSACCADIRDVHHPRLSLFLPSVLPPFLEMQDTNNHHHDRTILTRLKSVIVAIHAVIQPGPAQVLGLFLFFFSSMGLLL